MSLYDSSENEFACALGRNVCTLTKRKVNEPKSNSYLSPWKKRTRKTIIHCIKLKEFLFGEWSKVRSKC